MRTITRSAARSALALATVASSTLALAGVAQADDAATPSPTATTSNPAPPAATSSPAPPAACDADGGWPAAVQGIPEPGRGADGFYLGHNPKGGWVLRVTHPTWPGRANRAVFSGTIETAGRFDHVTGVKLEKDDRYQVSSDGRTLHFRFVNYGATDGIDFTTTCAPGLRADFLTDGGRTQVRFIHLGAKGVHPDHDPFVINRRAEAPTGGA